MDKFVWWNCSDLQDEGLFRRIVAEGCDNLRLEFHPKHADGANRLVLVNKSGATIESHEGGSFNISHECPPDCP